MPTPRIARAVGAVRLAGWAVAAGVLAGCAEPPPPRAAAPHDPDAMAAAALREYDRDGNGALNGPELDACPAVREALPEIDKDGDGAASGAELAARFRSYRAGTVAVACTVTLGKKPLVGAVVTFTPEGFMGGVGAAGAGTTDKSGRTIIEVPGAAGLTPGMYRITVSKKATTKAGAEQVPAKYNARTTLGREVAAGGRSGPVELALTP